MPDRAHINLGDPVFARRLYQPSVRKQLFRDPVSQQGRPSARYGSDIIVVVDRVPSAQKTDINNERLLKPSHPRAVQTVSMHRSSIPIYKQSNSETCPNPAGSPKRTRQLYTKLQLGVFSMACLVFIFGIIASLQTLQANHMASAQVSALATRSDRQAASPSNSQSNTVPSVTKPNPSVITNYAVAPRLPRYLNIATLGVHARVVSLGILNSGALATPNNIYDVGWYNESSQPGQPGAVLIDGHVSSWTSKGVFYGIKGLKPGAQLQIQLGDGTTFIYKVIKSQVYPDRNVDMEAAIKPVTVGKPGLNLITCTGNVRPGTNEFTERVIVYTEQI